MEQKKYKEIVRLGHRSTIGMFNVGDEIVIQEKIDGANASFLLEDGKIRAFSRRQEINEENNLNGFYQFAQSLNKKMLLNNLIYFGEWTTPHKVKYPKNNRKFYLFDIYDVEKEEYLNYRDMLMIGNVAGLNTVPIFYTGPYISYEHLESYIGRTDIGGMLGDKEQGEGIVVKSDYRDKYGVQQFVKLVTESFREVQKQKAPRDPNKVTPEMTFATEVVTKPRIEKLIFRMVDEGKLHEHWGIEDMSTILRGISADVIEDVFKEESEMLPEDYDEKKIKKAIGKRIPSLVKEIINDKSN